VADDVKFSNVGAGDTDRVFLLSDVASQKPKYLQALALGIPCVSTNWLKSMSIGVHSDWTAHLLPSGYSEPLSARVSQMVDLDWGNSLEQLHGIMANPVPHKVLSGKSILCLGEELLPVPLKTNRRSDTSSSMLASRKVPLIVLGMGAKRVEAAADLRNASQKDLGKYDYIVVKDLPRHALKNAQYVDVQWVKECLIAGRLFPSRVLHE